MKALKPETQKPELCRAGWLSSASAARGPGDERRADLLTSRRSLGHGAGDWIQEGGLNLEQVRSSLRRVPIGRGEVPRVRVSSGPAAPDDVVSVDSAPAPALAPAPSSGGPPGCSEGPLGSRDTARVRCTPWKEQARLCELGSVKNGWLPLHKRPLLFGVPRCACDAEDPPHQEDMKAYIAATTPKGYTKRLNGNDHIVSTYGNRVEKCTKALGSTQLESRGHQNIHQTSSCWNAPDRHGERNTSEEKRTCWPPRSGSSVDSVAGLLRGSPVRRTVSAPSDEDSDPKNPPKTESSFSSITITTRKVPQTAGAPLGQDLSDMARMAHDRWRASQAQGPVTQGPQTNPAPPRALVTGSDYEPVALRKKPVIVKVTEFREVYRTGAGPTAGRPPEFRHSYSEGDRKRDAPSWLRGRPREPSLEVPSGRNSSALYHDKPLSLSLEGGRQVHRSTLSLHLSGTPPPAPEDGSDGPRRAPMCSDVTPLPLSRWNLRATRKSEPGAESDGPPESNTLTASPALGDAPRSCAGTAGSCEKPGEGIRTRERDPEKRLSVRSQARECEVPKGLSVILTHSPDPVIVDLKRQSRSTPRSAAAPGSKAPPDSVTAHGEDSTRSLRVEGVVRRGPRRAVWESGPPRPSSWAVSVPKSQNSTARSLTLREALELYRPDFIARSQRRVKELEEQVRKRRANQGSDTSLEQRRGPQRRNCTTPHPLSDNLFRPRGRSISWKDMQLRSKRIYNKLPEVTRKKEEEKKRVLFQTNRLRAETFKKKILDQILQRNGD